MKKTTKKRQILAASLIIALAAAVTMNWYYSKSVPQSGETAGENGETHMLGDTVLVAGKAVDTAPEAAAADDAAFSELQMKQTQTFDVLEEKIEAVLSREQLDDAAQSEVTKLLETIKTNREAQTNCETLIGAKVGGRSIVLLGEDGAQVVVERGRLNEQTTLQITEILQSTAGVSPENLTIMEVNS